MVDQLRPPYLIRPIRETELNVLEEMLYQAIYQPEGSEPLPRDIIYTPELMVYIDHFGQPQDHCLVAEVKGEIVGTVWTRVLTGPFQNFGNQDEYTPEFAIAVKDGYRHQGIGYALMESMICLLREKGYKQASLSVNKDNYAFRLYKKLGFQTMIEQQDSYLMLLRLV